eukprot:scaffold17293_cov32-Prasinocladus_malaysianus.AAC.1
MMSFHSSSKRDSDLFVHLLIGCAGCACLYPYQALASAIQQAGQWQGAIEIYPTLISVKCSPLHSTWQSLSRLPYFSAGRPPAGGTPSAKMIIHKLYTYAVRLLEYLTEKFSAMHRQGKQPQTHQHEAPTLRGSVLSG